MIFSSRSAATPLTMRRTSPTGSRVATTWVVSSLARLILLSMAGHVYDHPYHVCADGSPAPDSEPEQPSLCWRDQPAEPDVDGICRPAGLRQRTGSDHNVCRQCFGEIHQ